MAGAGEFTLGQEQLLLRDQHVDDRARAHFKACFAGLVSGLGRHDSEATGLDFRCAGDQVAIRASRSAGNGALLLLELVGHGITRVQGLAHP